MHSELWSVEVLKFEVLELRTTNTCTLMRRRYFPNYCAPGSPTLQHFELQHSNTFLHLMKILLHLPPHDYINIPYSNNVPNSQGCEEVEHLCPGIEMSVR
jgi:hypothetical protein